MEERDLAFKPIEEMTKKEIQELIDWNQNEIDETNGVIKALKYELKRRK